MVKRNQRTGAKPVRANPESRPALAPETHSGEGSASALATWQKLETRRRLGTRAADAAPPIEEPGKSS